MKKLFTTLLVFGISVFAFSQEADTEEGNTEYIESETLEILPPGEIEARMKEEMLRIEDQMGDQNPKDEPKGRKEEVETQN